MITVRFNQHFDIYTGGEVAGFPPQRAQELVALGVATVVEFSAPRAVPEHSDVIVAAAAPVTLKGKGKKLPGE